MTLKKTDPSRFNEIDESIRIPDTGFSKMALKPYESAKYEAWYGLALSSIALVTGSDELLFGDGALGPGDGVKITLFTSTLVVVVNVESTTELEKLPQAMAVPRRAISNLAVTAGMGVPTDTGAEYDWPGTIRVEAEYLGLEEPIRLTGPSHDTNTKDDTSKLQHMLMALRADLLGP